MLLFTLIILFIIIYNIQAYKNVTLMREYANNNLINMIIVKTDGSVSLYKNENIWRYDYFYRILKYINREKAVSKDIPFLLSSLDEPLLLSKNCPLINTSWNFHIRNHEIIINNDHIDKLLAISTSTALDCHLDIPVPYVAMSDGYLKINENEIPLWRNKIPILFWRGSATGGKVNNSLYSNHRYRTVKFLNQFEWSDVKLTNTAELGVLSEEESEGLLGEVVPLDDMCKYKYLLNIAGWSSAYRLNMLTKCKSVIISMSPILDLVDKAIYPYYYRIQDENEIPVIMEYLLSHDKEANIMSDKMYNIARTRITYNRMYDYSKSLLRKLEEEEFIY